MAEWAVQVHIDVTAALLEDGVSLGKEEVEELERKQSQSRTHPHTHTVGRTLFVVSGSEHSQVHARQCIGLHVSACVASHGCSWTLHVSAWLLHVSHVSAWLRAWPFHAQRDSHSGSSHILEGKSPQGVSGASPPRCGQNQHSLYP